MKILFYLPVLILGFYYTYKAFGSLRLLKEIYKIRKESDKSLTTIGKELGEREDSLEGDTMSIKNKLVLTGCMAILAVLLSLVGLFSFNWPIFLLIFSSSIIIGQINKLFPRSIKINMLISRTQYLISGVGYIFAAINSYHLKLDLAQIIQNLF